MAVLGEKVGDLGVEGSDALVEIVDVVAEFADAAGCDSLSQAVAEGDALEFAQLALAVTAKGGGFADGSCCVRQNGAAGCLGAVSDKPSSLQLERHGSNDLGPLGRSELLAGSEHDVSD